MDERRIDLDGQRLMPWAPVKCEGCGRLLTSETSMRRHMGRKCWRKSQADLLSETKPESPASMAGGPADEPRGSQQEDWL